MTDIEKILKFVGFKWWEEAEAWCYGKDEVTRNPDLDMNFFDNHVVPKLGDDYCITLTRRPKHAVEICIEYYPNGEYKEYIGKGKDPNQAWQEAVLKLVEG